MKKPYNSAPAATEVRLEHEIRVTTEPSLVQTAMTRTSTSVPPNSPRAAVPSGFIVTIVSLVPHHSATATPVTPQLSCCILAPPDPLYGNGAVRAEGQRRTYGEDGFPESNAGSAYGHAT